MAYSRRLRWGDGRSGLPRVEFSAELEARVVPRRPPLPEPPPEREGPQVPERPRRRLPPL